MNIRGDSASKSGTLKVMALGLVTVMTTFAASGALADRYRTVVIHETVRTAPVVAAPVVIVQSSPVYVTSVPAYHTGVVYGPGHHSVSTTTRTTTTTTVRTSGSGFTHAPVYHHSGYTVVSHPGHRHGHYRQPAASRGNWSSNRRDVIYVDRKGARNSSYREVERRSVVIRERR